MEGITTESTRTTWWCRPGGGREVLAVAAPLVVSSLSWTVMTFVDRMLLNHWSGAAMAAAFIASITWFAALCLPLGICAYTGTFVAQYHGAGKPRRIGPSVWQGVWIALAASPFILAAIPFAEPLFALAQHGPEALALESQYFAILCWGAPALLIAQSLSSFYSGRSKTVMVMIVDALFALLNVLLDYWWIFGLTVGGQEIFSAMGIAGAGWATVVSLWLKAAVYLALMLQRSHRRDFATGSMEIDTALFRRMLTYGGPNGVQMLLNVLGFMVFILLIGRLGAIETEATSMTFSIGSLAFMPVEGLGMAVSILVGQHLGENRSRIAEQVTWTSLHVAWIYMAIVSALFLFLPELFLTGFATSETALAELTPEEAKHQATVLETATTLLWFVAAYNFLDAMLIVFVSAIKGAGDTQFVLYTSLVMATLLAILSWVAVEVLGSGLYECWAIITAFIVGLGVIYFLRFQAGKWKTMRVIEET